MPRFHLAVALLAVVSLVPPARAKSSRHSVLDFYKLLPQSRFFEIPEKERLSWLRDGMRAQVPSDNRSVVDLRHDFLRAAGDGAQGRLDLAVFRYHGEETLAVFNAFDDGELSFWRLSKGRLHEVTKSVFPFRLPECSVELPRQGTTIRALRGDGSEVFPSKTVLARFGWRGGRFYRLSR